MKHSIDILFPGRLARAQATGMLLTTAIQQRFFG
jgi:hypothetical protein